MLSKLSQQQLEVIRGKYLEQNKSLAQQNSTLLMKCNLLEGKISQLLKENTQLKNSELRIEKQYRDTLGGLETLVDAKLHEILGYIDSVKSKKEPIPRVVPNKKVFQILEDSIPEEEEEGEKQEVLQVQYSTSKADPVVNAISELEEVEDSLVEGNQEVLEIPKDKRAITEIELPEPAEETSKATAPLEETLNSEVEPNVEEILPTVSSIPKQSKTKSASSSSDLITDRPRSKRRRKSDINYKLPSLKHKMRRMSGKWDNAVYEKDDLITVDKRRDSFGNWLDKRSGQENNLMHSQELNVPDQLVLDTTPQLLELYSERKQTDLKDKTEVLPTNKAEVLIATTTEAVSVPKNEQGKEVNKLHSTRRDSMHPKVTKKLLSDITNRQNVKSNSGSLLSKDKNHSNKLKSISEELSIFDFVEEDSLERKTIFNRRRNSII